MILLFKTNGRDSMFWFEIGRGKAAKTLASKLNEEGKCINKRFFRNEEDHNLGDRMITHNRRIDRGFRGEILLGTVVHFKISVWSNSGIESVYVNRE